MKNYSRNLQYPINIKNTNPAMAKVIISQYYSIEIKTDTLGYTPLMPISKVWFGITRVCPLEREGIDFGSFNIHSEIMCKPER